MCLIAAAALMSAACPPASPPPQPQKAAMTQNQLPAPPRAEQRPHRYERHGYTVEDPYFWLKDQGYPKIDDEDVLAYLKEENAYFETAMKPHRPLVDTLFEEMKGRIKEDESSVPIRDGAWLYWWAFKPGAQYRTWYRKPVAGGAEQVVFDEAAEAEGKEYFRLGAIEISPDGKRAATLVDDSGSERFDLRIRDLATGKDIETITEVGIGTPVWTNDSKGVVFNEVNENWRSYRARYHRLGADPAAAVTLYEEKDELGFTVGLSKSQDRSLIFISTGDNATNEVRFVSADDPSQPLTLVSPRKEKRQYSLDASHGKLWVLTNDDHVNFRIAEADPAKPGEWKTVIPGSDRVYLRGLTAYRDHLAITQSTDGLDELRLRGDDGAEERIPLKEAA